MQTTPTRLMQIQILRELPPRGVQPLQPMPHDETMTFSWHIYLLLTGYPPAFFLTSPSIQNENEKRTRILPTPFGVPSGKVRTISLLGLSFFRSLFILFYPDVLPYHQVMGDISPSYFISRGVVPASRLPFPTCHLPLVFVVLVHSCISSLPSIVFLSLAGQ